VTRETEPTQSDIPGISPGEVSRLGEDSAVLLDVREPEEWAVGHAPGAVHVPTGELEAVLPGLLADRCVVVVCRSGRRSAATTRLLRAAGLDARNLDGGMVAWEEAGLAVITSRGGEGRVS
jgi:rhodanese-related sulfurtransferase